MFGFIKHSIAAAVDVVSLPIAIAADVAAVVGVVKESQHELGHTGATVERALDNVEDAFDSVGN